MVLSSIGENVQDGRFSNHDNFVVLPKTAHFELSLYISGGDGGVPFESKARQNLV